MFLKNSFCHLKGHYVVCIVLIWKNRIVPSFSLFIFPFPAVYLYMCARVIRSVNATSKQSKIKNRSYPQNTHYKPNTWNCMKKNCLHFFQEYNQSFDNVLIVLKFDECNVIIINSIVKFNTVISQSLNFFRMKKEKKFFLHFYTH